MATIEKTAARRQVAMERIEKLKNELAAELGVELVAKPKVKTQDPQLILVFQLEEFADVLETVVASVKKSETVEVPKPAAPKKANRSKATE